MTSTQNLRLVVCYFNYGNPIIPVQTRLKLADADFGQLLAPECHHYILKWKLKWKRKASSRESSLTA